MQKTNFLTTILFLTSFAGISQSKFDTIYVSKAAAIVDLDQLDQRIKKNYKPFDLPLVQDAYEQSFLDTKASISERISVSQLRLKVMRLIATLREAHFRVGISAERERKKKGDKKKLTLLPFDLSLQNSVFRVHHDYRNDTLDVLESIGSIISIGVNSVREILEKISPSLIRDIEDAAATNAFIGTYAPIYYKSFFDLKNADSTKITYINNAQQKTVTVAYIARQKKSKPNRYIYLDSTSTAIIKIKTISTHGTYSDTLYQSLLKKSIQALEEDRPANTILDLRGCLGGSRKGTRKWISLFIEGGKEISRSNKHAGIFFPFLFATKFKTGNRLKAKRRTKNQGYRYSGNVFVITDESVFSGGTLIASVLKRYNKATIIGQPTGGKYYGTNAGFNKIIVLDHSNIAVSIPQLYIRVDGKSDINMVIEGVQPDHFLPYDYDANNRDGYDATMEYVLDLIRNK